MDTAEDVAQCSICKELFSEPRMLPCIHNFCLRCLQQAASQTTKGPGDRMACHCCAKEFTIPPGGMADLQRSLFIEDLVEEMKAAKKSGTQCDVCLVKSGGKDFRINAAKMYCSECKQKLCRTCSEHHRKQKVSRKHHVTILKLSEVKEPTSSVDCCSVHDHHQLSVYCFECKLIVCDECCKQTHAMHTCKPVDEVIETSKKQVITDLEMLASHSKIGSARKEQLDTIKIDCLKGFVDVEAEVIEKGRKLKELIDGHVGHLLSQLVLMKTKRMYEIDSRINELETCLGLTESFEKSCSAMSLKTSSLEICNEGAVLNKKAVQIQKLYDACDLKDLYSATVILDTSQAEDKLLQMRNIVGEIREELKPVTTNTETLMTEPIARNSDALISNLPSEMSPVAPVVEEMQSKVIERELEPASIQMEMSPIAPVAEEVQLKVIEREQKPAAIQMAFDPSRIRHSTKLDLVANVCGVAKLSRCIYVLVRNPNAIHVFLDQRPFRSTSQIPINEIKKPHDMAAAEKQNCLFVTDSETKCVWKIADDKTITKWLSDIGGPFTLFVTPDSRLVMARQDKPSKIEIYKEDACLDCLIPLPVNIEEPLHAVENSGGNLVVSHKWRESGARETVWGISVVNSRGEILHRFCAKDEVQCVKDPQYLSVDSVDQVLVADFGNGRIVLLNADLSWNRILETDDRDAIMYPKKLYLDGEGRQLLVGQYLKKGVHVYTF